MAHAKLAPTGDAKLDKALAAAAAGGGANPAARRKLVRALEAWKHDAVTARLAEIMRAAAAQLDGIGHIPSKLRKPALVMRVCMRALAGRRDPRAEDAIVELWRTSPIRSVTRYRAAKTLLGHVDALDDDGHATTELDPARVASARALAPIAALFSVSKNLDQQSLAMDAILLSDPARSFTKLGKYLTSTSTRERDEDLRSSVLSLLARHVRVLVINGDPRWRAPVEELAAEKDFTAKTIVKWVWNKKPTVVK